MSGNVMITCATGGLGSTIFDFLLQKAKPETVFATCRDDKKPEAVRIAKRGVTVRKSDYNDKDSLVAAFEGINTLMFISSGTIEKRVEQHSNVIKAALECKVKHIVYTSFLKVTKDSKFIYAADHFATETEIKKSYKTMAYTMFRNAFYQENIPGMLGDALETGKWEFPAESAKINMVARSDVAKGLAMILLNVTPFANKAYQIASNDSTTFEEIAKAVSKVTGKTVTYKSISPDDYKKKLKDAKVDDAEIDMYVSMGEAIVAGEADYTDTPWLGKLLGRKSKSLEEYLPVVFKKKK